MKNKKHLKNVGPISDCEQPHAHSPGVATGTVVRRLCIDVHDDNDNDENDNAYTWHISRPASTNLDIHVGVTDSPVSR